MLHSARHTDNTTAADAAKALEPLVHSFPYSGYLSKLIFAVGIIGLGLLCTHISGFRCLRIKWALNLRSGLYLQLQKAYGFYGILTGRDISWFGYQLHWDWSYQNTRFYAAVINGHRCRPLDLFISKIANNQELWVNIKVGALSPLLVWATFIGMGCHQLHYFYHYLRFKEALFTPETNQYNRDEFDQIPL